MKRINYLKGAQILSAFLGFIGTIIMVSGVLTSSSNDIAKLGGLYFEINPNLLRNIAESKADTVCGISLVCISFLMQMMLLLFENKLISRYLIVTKKILITIITTTLLAIIGFWFLHSHMISTTIFSTKKEMAYLSLKNQFDYNKSHNQTSNGKVVLSEGQIKVIKDYIEELSFDRKNGETDIEFMKRFYRYLNLNVVDEINFSMSDIK